MAGNEPIILDCLEGDSALPLMGGGDQAELLRLDLGGGGICNRNLNRGTERWLQTLSQHKGAKELWIDELENRKVMQS